MNLFELVIIAVGLSMDAFAVAVCKGLSLKKITAQAMLIVGAYFGLFQGIMPLIGYLAGINFAELIQSFDHWIAFLLLLFIGGKMIIGSFHSERCADRSCPENSLCTDRQCPLAVDQEKKASLNFRVMLPLALATSIDALAVGVTFAFLKINILIAVLLIGIITFAFSAAGVKIGSVFGTKIKNKAEIFGGAILILIGLKILLEHLGILFA